MEQTTDSGHSSGTDISLMIGRIPKNGIAEGRSTTSRLSGFTTATRKVMSTTTRFIKLSGWTTFGFPALVPILIGIFLETFNNTLHYEKVKEEELVHLHRTGTPGLPSEERNTCIGGKDIPVNAENTPKTVTKSKTSTSHVDETLGILQASICDDSKRPRQLPEQTNINFSKDKFLLCDNIYETSSTENRLQDFESQNEHSNRKGVDGLKLEMPNRESENVVNQYESNVVTPDKQDSPSESILSATVSSDQTQSNLFNAGSHSVVRNTKTNVPSDFTMVRNRNEFLYDDFDELVAEETYSSFSEDEIDISGLPDSDEEYRTTFNDMIDVETFEEHFVEKRGDVPTKNYKTNKEGDLKFGIMDIESFDDDVKRTEDKTRNHDNMKAGFTDMIDVETHEENPDDEDDWDDDDEYDDEDDEFSANLWGNFVDMIDTETKEEGNNAKVMKHSANSSENEKSKFDDMIDLETHEDDYSNDVEYAPSHDERKNGFFDMIDSETFENNEPEYFEEDEDIREHWPDKSKNFEDMIDLATRGNGVDTVEDEFWNNEDESDFHDMIDVETHTQDEEDDSHDEDEYFPEMGLTTGLEEMGENFRKFGVAANFKQDNNYCDVKDAEKRLGNSSDLSADDKYFEVQSPTQKRVTTEAKPQTLQAGSFIGKTTLPQGEAQVGSSHHAAVHRGRNPDSRTDRRVKIREALRATFGLD